MFRVSKLLALNGLTDPWWFTAEAAERGHTVHVIGEQVLTRQPVCVAPAYRGYEQALRDGVAALDLRPICVERRLSNDDVTGRPDVIGWLPKRIGRLHEGPIIVDIKSGARFASHGVQLGFYEMLAEATPDLRAALPAEYRDFPWQRVGLYVRDTGRYSVYPYLDSADRNVCLAIVDITRFRVHHGMIAASDVVAQSDDPTFEPETTTHVGAVTLDDSRPQEPGDHALPRAGA